MDYEVTLLVDYPCQVFCDGAFVCNTKGRSRIVHSERGTQMKEPLRPINEGRYG